MIFKHLLTVALVCFVAAGATATMAAELYVGAASADITPNQPVALDGQMGLRVSQKPATPISANVLAIESRHDGQPQDAAVMVSCDLVLISDMLLMDVKKVLQKRLPDFDQSKLILNATHTHTAPVTRSGIYDIPKDVMQPDAYCSFAANRIADAIEKAWNGRKPSSFTWGLGHAAVAENRRATYADGHAVMYGNTNQADFQGLEGYEDHDIGSLFFWNSDGKLIAIAVNVSCPSQEVEGDFAINADFWHPVRESLRKRYGSDVCVLGWAGAAGDLSPHLMYRKAAEDRMQTLRKLSRLDELARRIVLAVNETFEAVKDDRHADATVMHKTETLKLPMRIVTDAEYADAKNVMTTQNPGQMMKRWYQAIVDRYERQKTDPKPIAESPLHVVRIGDIVICTSPFEMFTDYGVQIKARSKANQTFIVQLSGPPATYLPTKRAVAGGGYSAVVQSNTFGPEGAQMFVGRTVELIEALWSQTKQE